MQELKAKICIFRKKAVILRREILKYKISDTITFYRTNVIDGNGCFIMMDDNFRGESRFAFRYDHTANDNNILDTFIMGNEIKNFNIQHSRFICS